jgi:periplasmic protein TonB
MAPVPAYRPADRRRRLAGFALAIAAEALLVLLLLTLAPADRPADKAREVPNTFTLAPDAPAPEPSAAPVPPARSAAAVEPRPEPEPQPAPPAPALPPPAAPPPPAFIPVAPGQLDALDLATLPRSAPAAPRRGVAGPPNIGGGPADTPRVGTAPNGEPLYAAAWYREPSDDELRGYLSTARGPGWALIACRTVADFRVEDCAPIAEEPERSGMLRAVLAAAWQFRVRPPIRGGQYQVGDWVRIRIEYGLRVR